MNILIINCSPVKNGATAEIVNLVNYFIKNNNNIRCICIDDYEIQFCKGCKKCHIRPECFQDDDVKKIIEHFVWADKIVCISPSYWADVPGQFKVFIDRCTPWCNTHVPHATIPQGKKGYVIALRTGSNMLECKKVIGSIEHFYGHLEIESAGSLGLCSIVNKNDVIDQQEKIMEFCNEVILA